MPTRSLATSCLIPLAIVGLSYAKEMIPVSHNVPPLVSLADSLSALQEGFNADQDSPRLVAIFSPT